MEEKSFSTTSQSYKEALLALNSLQSNAQAIEQWISARRTNPNADLKLEMLDLCDRLHIELKSLQTKVIHVAGTKGKGSTCAFTESILRSHGLKTGLYTSPHLVSVRERIAINGKPLSQDRFASHFWECWNALQATKSAEYPNMPQYFRFLTLLAFKVFIDEKVDVAVIETGVGGRTDATNIFEEPMVCGITPIGFDHMNVLGNTLTEIAFEKSGIFKHGVPAFTSNQTDEAMKELVRRAKLLIGNDGVLTYVPPLAPSLGELGLKGEHQRMNAALAIAMSKMFLQRAGLSTSRESVEDIASTKSLTQEVARGLGECHWPGRGEKIALEGHSVTMFLDGAHTPESMEACKQWFFDRATTSEDALKVFVFNCNPSREPSTLLKAMAGCQFDLVIFTTNDTGKAHILEDKRPVKEREATSVSWQEGNRGVWQSLSNSSAPCKIAGSIPQVLEELQSFEKANPLKRIEVLATGSLYLVGAFLEILKPEMCDVV